jgi:hypothetical protein
MTLTGLFAPRVGVLYDWTREGRSKLFAHWGRFYESIPMDLSDRSFSGETDYRQVFAPGCSNEDDPAIGGRNGEACVGEANMRGSRERLLGANGVLVAPGIRSQYVDELLAGIELELFEDLTLGVAYQQRRLGRVIEDVSTDGANTYILANPGEWSADEERTLADRIARADDAATRSRLERQLALFRGIRRFDRPWRDHHAIQLTVSSRVSRRLHVEGSYTYQRTQGNYGGLFSADNGQFDPNISSQYDLVELLANRVGPLPQDRPHHLRIAGYYEHALPRVGELIVGTRLRAQSGVPTNALAAHYEYGANESFLLPRGQLGRTAFDHGVDLHLGVGRQLSPRVKLELFVDVFNVYNRQGAATVDQTYAPRFRQAGATPGGSLQAANPVSGGTYEDLIFVKAIDAEGEESAMPIGRNPNFRNTASRYEPAYARLGVRLSF